MTRVASRVDVGRAREMRKAGMTLEQIGNEFGVTRQRIRQLVGSPPRPKVCPECDGDFTTGRSSQRFCSDRCRDRYAARATCECGKPKSVRADLCVSCRRALQDAAREERYQRLADLWAEGLTMEEIASEIGTTKNALGGELVRARAAGFDLPFRRASAPREPISKTECRNQFGQALRRGDIRRAARCERCGEVARTEGHHTDYSRPLFVEWLCNPCHMEHHAAERRAA